MKTKEKTKRNRKPAIEAALQKLKAAHAAQNIADIDAATAELNNVMQAASQQMYQGAGAQQPGGQQYQGGAQQDNSSANNGADDVQDADFEEVK